MAKKKTKKMFYDKLLFTHDTEYFIFLVWATFVVVFLSQLIT